MVELEKYDFKSYEFNEGTQVKKIVELNGKKYIFKACNGFPYQETPTCFGEVLYSRISEKVYFDCVKAQFAKMKIEGVDCKGCLIQHYGTDDMIDAVSYGQIVRILQQRAKVRIKSDMSVDNIVKNVEYYASYIGVSVDTARLEENLSKLAIFDFLVHQSDRHEDNIDFVINKDRIKMAPAFDNGFCFNLTVTDKYIKMRENLQIKQLLYFKPIEFFSEADNYEYIFCNHINSAANKNPNLKNFILGLANLDMAKEVKSLNKEVEGGFLSKDYLEDTINIYNGRMKTLLDVMNISKKDLNKLAKSETKESEHSLSF